MTLTRRIAFSAAFLSLGGPGSALAVQTERPDPFVGTWVLNTEQSRFPGGNGPANLTFTFEALENGQMRFTAQIELPDGTKPPPQMQVFSYDEQDAPVEGGTLTRTRSTERTDPRTLSMTFKNDEGRVVEIMRFRVSDDGSTLTQNLRFITADREIESLAVFDRQSTPAVRSRRWPAGQS